MCGTRRRLNFLAQQQIIEDKYPEPFDKCWPAYDGETLHTIRRRPVFFSSYSEYVCSQSALIRDNSFAVLTVAVRLLTKSNLTAVTRPRISGLKNISTGSTSLERWVWEMQMRQGKIMKTYIVTAVDGISRQRADMLSISGWQASKKDMDTFDLQGSTTDCLSRTFSIIRPIAKLKSTNSTRLLVYDGEHGPYVPATERNTRYGSRGGKNSVTGVLYLAQAVHKLNKSRARTHPTKLRVTPTSQNLVLKGREQNWCKPRHIFLIDMPCIPNVKFLVLHAEQFRLSSVLSSPFFVSSALLSRIHFFNYVVDIKSRTVQCCLRGGDLEFNPFPEPPLSVEFIEVYVLAKALEWASGMSVCHCQVKRSTKINNLFNVLQTGIASSAPPLPPLEPSGSNSRWSTVWGKVDIVQFTQPGASIAIEVYGLDGGGARTACQTDDPSVMRGPDHVICDFLIIPCPTSATWSEFGNEMGSDGGKELSDVILEAPVGLWIGSQREKGIKEIEEIEVRCGYKALVGRNCKLAVVLYSSVQLLQPTLPPLRLLPSLGIRHQKLITLIASSLSLSGASISQRTGVELGSIGELANSSIDRHRNPSYTVKAFK
ncbi:hypothetical protein FB446DRAFT_708612 [Lentinula raphanica]|nr:hypothetical protein FB446DRAFT_708612 [Lentinula raphanica]